MNAVLVYFVRDMRRWIRGRFNVWSALSMPAAWLPGIRFSTRPLLRAAIILYGFRVTFQDVAHVGMEGALISVSVVLSTFTLGIFVGTKFLGLDRKTAILTTVGSSVCGAAAILATEPVIKAESHKSSMAVATVVDLDVRSPAAPRSCVASPSVPLSAKRVNSQ